MAGAVAPDLSFQVQSKLNRVLVLPPNRQAAWGTPVPDTALTRVQRFDGSAVADFGTDRRTDQQMSGKGSSFATNSQATMRSVKLTGVKCEATDWNVAWVLTNLMGRLVSAGSAAPYTHTVTFDQTTRTCIPTTAYLQDTADVAYRLLDMFPTSATLTVGAKGSISLDFDMMGTGQKVMGVLATAPVIPAETYLYGNDALCTFGPAAAGAIFTGRHMSSTIKLDNQGMVHEAPGGGLHGIFGRRGDPKFSIDTVIAATDIDDVFTHFDTDDLMTYQLNVPSGPNCQLLITVPSCRLKATKLGFDGDMPVWNITLDETSCFQVGNVPPITVQVTSSQPTFLTTP